MGLISKQSLLDAGRDSDDLGRVVNEAADYAGTGLVVTRRGGPIRTLRKLFADILADPPVGWLLAFANSPLRGKDGSPPQRKSFRATEGQRRFPAQGSLDKEISGSTLDVVVGGLVNDPLTLDWVATLKPNGLVDYVTFTSDIRADVIVSLNGYRAAGDGSSTPTPDTDFPTVALHTYRLAGETSDVAALKRACDDVSNPLSVNHGCVIVPVWRKGAATQLDATDQAAIDPITQQAVEPEFVAQVGDYLIGTYNQNQQAGNAGNFTYSGVTIWDPSGRARFRRADRGAPHLLHCSPIPTQDTTVGGVDSQAYLYKRNRLIGLTFLGENWRLGYREFCDDLHFNSVEAFEVTDCRFLGSTSDGLHWGAGVVGGGSQNHLNRACRWTRCFFDGYNTNNRNAVSIISGDDMKYDDFRVRRFTRRGNGNVTPADPFDPATGIGNPGPLDIEPNTQFTPDPRVTDCGGRGLHATGCGGAAVAFLPGTGNNIPHPVRSFRFYETVTRDVQKGLVQAFAAAEATVDFDVLFLGFSVEGGERGFEIVYCRGVTLRSGSFRGYDYTSVSGYVSGQRNRGLTLEDVTFEDCGRLSGATLDLRGLDLCFWGKVTFRDCNGTAVVFRGGNEFKNSNLGRLVFERNAGAPRAMISSIVAIADDLDNSGSPDSDGMPVIDGATLAVTGVEIIGDVIPPQVPLLGMPSRQPPSAPPNTKLWYSEPSYYSTAPLMERGGPRGYNGAPSAPGQPLDFYPDLPVTGGRVDTAGNPLENKTITGALTVEAATGRITAGKGGGSIRANNMNGEYYVDPTGQGIGIEWAEPHSGQAGVAVGIQVSGAQPYTALVDTVPASGRLRDLIQGGAFGEEYGVLTFGRLMRATVLYQTLPGRGTSTFFRKFMADSTSSTGWREVGTPVNMGVFPGSQASPARLRADLTSYASIQVTRIGSAADLIPQLPSS